MNVSRLLHTTGLRVKLTVLIESMIVLIVLLTGIATMIREIRNLEYELYKRGLALAKDLATFVARPLLQQDLPTLRRFINHTMAQDYVLYAMLLDPKGTVIMHSDLTRVGQSLDGHDEIQPCKRQLTYRFLFGWPDQPGLECDLSVPVAIESTRIGTVVMGYSYSAVEKEIALARRQILIIAGVNILIGGVVAFALAGFITAPIKRMIEATDSLAGGNPKKALSVNRSDEIGVLMRSFNDMAEEIEKHRSHLQNQVLKRTAMLENTNNQLLAEIDEHKKTQDKLRSSRQRLRELALHIQHAREEESRRIAREIHDELGQALTALKLDLHWMVPRVDKNVPGLAGKINAMFQLIDTTIKSVRRISTELRPGLLDDFGLSAAMEWQAGEFTNRTGIKCRFHSDSEPIIIDPDRSVALFRIFQETLTNIARHAEATKVDVHFKHQGETILLMVKDNGRGITDDQIGDSKSFGIIGMHERVNQFGGHLEIMGQPGLGTCITVHLPTEGAS